MGYRIEYVGGRCERIANRTELIKKLKTLKKSEVLDIRKTYKIGFSDGAHEKYERYLKEG